MPASGKSSNRRREQARGYHTGHGQGPYALQGVRQREAELAAGAAMAERAMAKLRSEGRNGRSVWLSPETAEPTT